MKLLLSALLLLTAAAASLEAGEQVQAGPGDGKTPAPPGRRASWLPDDPASPITAGFRASRHLSGASLDNITGIYATQERDTFFYLNDIYRYEDNGQLLQSNGASLRHRPGEREVILGGNVWYDAINSEHGHDFNSLGLGAEVLSHWVDARFNYYLPENKEFEVDRSTRRRSTLEVQGGVITEQNRRRTFSLLESALEGADAEVGFLLPGVERYLEVRLFGGYFHYVNPYGSDYEGFKARLEARLLPGVMADVMYVSDSYIMGGHWAAGLRASVPFSIGNCLKFRNPFEGIGAYYRPRPRDFQERMSDMIIRTPAMLTTSGTRETSDRTRRERRF